MLQPALSKKDNNNNRNSNDNDDEGIRVYKYALVYSGAVKYIFFDK